MQLRHDRRRPVIIVLLLGMLGGLGVLFTPAAQASWCGAPTQPGNVALDAGLTAVAVGQSNIGNPDAYSLYACSDPGGQVFLTLTNDDPARPGHQVTLETCPLFAGCTLLPKAGTELGVPTAAIDPPLIDGNGRVGVVADTGPGVCVWLGSANCVLGGGTYSASQPLPEPVPNQADVDAVLYAADTPNRCLYYIGWAGPEFGAFFCTWDAQGVPFYVLSTLLT